MHAMNLSECQPIIKGPPTIAGLFGVVEICHAIQKSNTHPGATTSPSEQGPFPGISVRGHEMNQDVLSTAILVDTVD